MTGVTKRFGSTIAIRNLTLKIDRGEEVALLGPNGSGKTTLLRLIAGQIQPTSGTAKVLEFDTVRDQEKVKRSVGLVSHRSFLYDELDIEENLRFYGVFHNADDERLEKALDAANLQRYRHVTARHLSYGLRKRADIARSMLGDPEVLVLDELFSGLDQEACEMLVDHLKARKGKTLLVSSHSIEWVRDLCNRVIVLNNGSIVKDGMLSST